MTDNDDEKAIVYIRQVYAGHVGLRRKVDGTGNRSASIDTDDLGALLRALDKATDRFMKAEKATIDAISDLIILEEAVRIYIRAIDMHGGDDYFHFDRRAARMTIDRLLERDVP